MPLRVANAPCSWGVLEFDLGTSYPYTQVLAEMRETGYEGTELGDWGFLPTDPRELREVLQRYQLELVGAFVPVAFARREVHETGVEQALRVARLMAEAAGSHPFVILADDNGKDPVRTAQAGRISPELSLSPPQWEVFVEGVHRVAEAVRRETGLRVVFHHHCAGYVETPWEVEELLRRTDPSLVGLCLDTGHYRYAGGDPLEALQRYQERIWHVHFKDHSPQVAQQARQQGWDYFTAVRHGIFCELGQGDVPFPKIVQTLRDQGYQGWIVVEQDVLPGMGTPKESARRNRDYLRGLGL